MFEVAKDVNRALPRESLTLSRENSLSKETVNSPLSSDDNFTVLQLIESVKQ